MNKKIRNIFLTSLVLIILTAIAPAMGETSTTRGSANGMGYTQTTGNLGGANYVVRMPDSWNGMLIVGCHAYFMNRDPNQEFQFDNLAAVFIGQGYAYAASDYGAQGYCVNAGVNQTYQLTEYVISNYSVTGKVFIFGGSMGGEIALLLGEKYPGIYSGVLDMCGPKDLAASYSSGVVLAGSSLEQIRQIYGWPLSAPADATVQSFKDFAVTSGIDLVAETGGTPTTAPQAYEKISPVNHVNISIPIISLVGSNDYIVPLSQTNGYQSAVAAAGHSDLYRMIVVQGGGHIDAVTLVQAPAALSQLIAQANPTPSPTPTSTPTPTPTPTASPTATPTPVPAHSSTADPTPTLTPTPTPTPSPNVTLTPTSTPTVPELSPSALMLLFFTVAAIIIVATRKIGKEASFPRLF